MPPKKKYPPCMVSEIFTVLIGFFVMVSAIAFITWFGSAIGSAFDDEGSSYSAGLGGQAWGAIIGFIAGIAFFVNYFMTM